MDIADPVDTINNSDKRELAPCWRCGSRALKRTKELCLSKSAHNRTVYSLTCTSCGNQMQGFSRGQAIGRWQALARAVARRRDLADVHYIVIDTNTGEPFMSARTKGMARAEVEALTVDLNQRYDGFRRTRWRAARVRDGEREWL